MRNRVPKFYARGTLPYNLPAAEIERKVTQYNSDKHRYRHNADVPVHSTDIKRSRSGGIKSGTAFTILKAMIKGIIIKSRR